MGQQKQKGNSEIVGQNAQTSRQCYIWRFSEKTGSTDCNHIGTRKEAQKGIIGSCVKVNHHTSMVKLLRGQFLTLLSLGHTLSFQNTHKKNFKKPPNHQHDIVFYRVFFLLPSSLPHVLNTILLLP